MTVNKTGTCQLRAAQLLDDGAQRTVTDPAASGAKQFNTVEIEKP